ncbi:hypothetical protein TorRG33x02_015810 [Trema orientale]|uniref:Transmembrane protein n=1 Tax=Trema orientale TaxID=63057 RepID=A0A2P5FXW9_TREOI|nr:hypothetical protein TorRG33x02_015810 [Trema orientale]
MGQNPKTHHDVSLYILDNLPWKMLIKACEKGRRDSGCIQCDPIQNPILVLCFLVWLVGLLLLLLSPLNKREKHLYPIFYIFPLLQFFSRSTQIQRMGMLSNDLD